MTAVENTKSSVLNLDFDVNVLVKQIILNGIFKRILPNKNEIKLTEARGDFCQMLKERRQNAVYSMLINSFINYTNLESCPLKAPSFLLIIFITILFNIIVFQGHYFLKNLEITGGALPPIFPTGRYSVTLKGYVNRFGHVFTVVNTFNRV